MQHIILDVIGLLLIGIGFLILPLPIPLGAILITLGVLALAVSESAVRDLIRDTRKRSKRIDAWFTYLERRTPKDIAETLKKTNPRR